MMSFDVSQNLELVGLDPGAILSSSRSGDASSSELGPASLSADSIQASPSPLAFFGNVVQQIGTAMVNGDAVPPANGADSVEPVGMDEAISVLENLVALMSAQGSGLGSLDTSPASLPAQTKAGGELD